MHNHSISTSQPVIHRMAVLRLALVIAISVSLPVTSEPAAGLAGVDLKADRFEMAENGKTVIAQGNARAKKDRTEIQADAIVAWTSEDEIYAEGHVLWIEEGVVSRADRVLYNWKEHRGKIVNVDLRQIRPDRPLNWTLQAGEVQQQGERTFHTPHGSVSSCLFAEKHQHFTARRITFKRDHSLVLHHAVFFVHKAPVLYFPYFYRDMKYPWPWYRVGFGNSSEFGSFVKNDLGFQILPGVDLLLDADYYEDRGAGLGLDLEYENQHRIGYIDTYYIKDHGNDEGQIPLGTKNRYRVKFLHRELLTSPEPKKAGEGGSFWDAGRWQLDAEYHQFSDDGFLEEFFETEFQTDKEPENRLFLTGEWESTSVRALVQPRVNQFLDLAQSQQRGPSQPPAQTEYLPKVNFDILSRPLLDQHFLLTFGAEAARVRRRFDDSQPLSGSDALGRGREISRLDFSTELTAPMKLNLLHVEPFLFNRETFYEEQLVRSDDAWRTLYGAGLKLSSEFWRTFGTTNEKWDIHQLHHIVTPEITFLTEQDVSLGPDELIFFDAVDTEKPVDRIRFNLRNVVQTKRGDSTVNWLEFEIESSFFPSANRDNAGKDFSNILTDLRWSPHPKISLFNDNEINTDPVRLEVFNAGASVRPDENLLVSLSQRFSRETGLDSNRTIFQTSIQLTEKWAVSYFTDYDWEQRQVFDMNLLFRRTFHDWSLEIGYNFDRGKDDKTVFFFISPNGFRHKSANFPGIENSPQGQSLYW